MSERDRLRAENETLRARLARLAEAILRISEDLDLDVVLQEVVDSARSLTDARYGAITTLNSDGDLQDVVISGLGPEERQRLMGYPHGKALLRHLSDQREPVRTRDFVDYAAAVGFEGFEPPITGFLGMQIRVRDRHVGNIYIGKKHDGSDFTGGDEETLEMFAAQAALAITNARRYGDEQRAKADIEALVDTSPVGVVVLDVQTQRVVKVNKEARRILGNPTGEGRGLDRHLRRLSFRRMDSSAVPLRELPIMRAIDGAETVRAEELVIELPDGSAVTTLINVTPIAGEGPEPVSVVATIQDITPLEELQRLRAEFLGMVSHELRAPLTSIKGSAATVRASSMPLDPAEVRQFFRLIEEQADRMRDLINNLLDMTRIEAGTLSVAVEPTDLAAVIDQATSAFSSSGHRSSVEVDVAADLPRVWGDAERLVQVLHNLLSNAAEHSRQWSTIKVSAAMADLDVAVTVTDEGAGIAAERLPRLFTKFAQVGSGDRRPDRYGLGLAICKGIVESHGGRISAHSDGEGSGARFTFTVPAVDETAINPAAVPADTADGSKQAPVRVERILAIDDDPQTLRYVHTTLTDAGYVSILTGDPEQVAHLLETERPHLVLLNLMLPDTDGFDLMKHIPRILEVPVIILSGRGSDTHIARAFEMGVADYVVKPFSPTELLARISAALRRHSLAQHNEPYRIADLVVDYPTRSVTMAGRPAMLTPTEYRLLVELCTNAGRILTYDQLLQTIWGKAYTGDPQRVRTIVKDLRRKLGDDARNPTYILTVPGVGYRAATT